MAQQIVYNIPDRPECEVLVDGEWWFGEVRMWTQDVDGAWTANASYSRDGLTHLGTFPADQLRPVEGDYSRGRVTS